MILCVRCAIFVAAVQVLPDTERQSRHNHQGVCHADRLCLDLPGPNAMTKATINVLVIFWGEGECYSNSLLGQEGCGLILIGPFLFSVCFVNRYMISNKQRDDGVDEKP